MTQPRGLLGFQVIAQILIPFVKESQVHNGSEAAQY